MSSPNVILQAPAPPHGSQVPYRRSADDGALMGLSVVIVNWNAGALLVDCVRSVQAVLGAGLQGRAEVIVIDNGSIDDSVAELDSLVKAAGTQDQLPVVVIRNAENLGFGAACNRAVAEAHGHTILLLNPDCVLRPGSVERCMAEFDRSDLPVGICGIGLEDASGHIARSCHRFPGFGALLGSAFGLHAIWPRLADSRMVDWDHASDRSVDHVIGAFYMMRRDVFRALGGFDERFFVYLEDLDLSLRVARAGMVTRFIAEPRSFHLGGGVSRQVKAERLFYATRSRLLYAFKHLARWQAVLHLVATLLGEPLVRSAHCAGRGAWQDLRFTWRGFALLYRDLPHILQQAAR